MRNQSVDKAVDFVANAAFHGIIISFTSIVFLFNNAPNKSIQSQQLSGAFSGWIVALKYAKSKEKKLISIPAKLTTVKRINGAGKRID